MKVVPKYADSDTLQIEHDGIVEFQMFDHNLVRSVDSCRKLCDAETIMYHLPFGMHNILYYLHPSTRPELLDMVAHLEPGKEFIVAHAEVTLNIFEKMGGYELLEECSGIIYLENSIAMPTGYDFSVDSAWQIAEIAGVPTVCDLVHLQATEYLYGVRQTVPADCRYFHFAACLDKDGVRDKPKTHGRRHRCYEDILWDMQYLRERGATLEDAAVCTEISETDYVNRPDMNQELEWLRKYARDTYESGVGARAGSRPLNFNK